jgi:hypothetical protein
LYKLDIHCNGNEKRDLDSVKPEMERQTNAQQTSVEKTVDWMFSPLVEITVLE